MQLVFLALHLRKESHDAGESILAAQHGLARRLWQIAPGHVQRHSQLWRALAQLGEPRPVLRPVPRIDRAARAASVPGRESRGPDRSPPYCRIPGSAGHAPKGLLKLNSRGSGSRPGRWQFVHSNAPENRSRRRSSLRWLRPRGAAFFKDHFAGFAIGNLDGIHDARAIAPRSRQSGQAAQTPAA